MTREEQIKQNAKAYAIENYGEYDEHDYTDHSGSNMCHAVSEKAYIAGAHSRDKEIEELKKQRDNFKDRLLDALEKRDQLRNPWISVNELPEEDQDNKGYSVNVIGLFSDGRISHCFCSLDEDIWFFEGITIDRPTHWMPMPKV